MLKFTNTLNIWIGTVGFIYWWLSIDYYFVKKLFTVGITGIKSLSLKHIVS